MPNNVDLDGVFGNEVIVTEFDLLRMYVSIACKSDNPVIIDALDNLVMLVKLVEPEEVQSKLFYVNTHSHIAKSCQTHFNREEIYEIVDEVIKKGDNDTIFALDNLIDVARSCRPTKKKSR